MISQELLKIGMVVNTETGKYVVLGLGREVLANPEGVYYGGAIEQEEPLMIHVQNTCMVTLITDLTETIYSINEMMEAIRRSKKTYSKTRVAALNHLSGISS